MTAIRNKLHADGGERTHSVAMRYEYLEQIRTWSEKEVPLTQDFLARSGDTHAHVRNAKHLMFNTMLSLGWTIRLW